MGVITSHRAWQLLASQTSDQSWGDAKAFEQGSPGIRSFCNCHVDLRRNGKSTQQNMCQVILCHTPASIRSPRVRRCGMLRHRKCLKDNHGGCVMASSIRRSMSGGCNFLVEAVKFGKYFGKEAWNHLIERPYLVEIFIVLLVKPVGVLSEALNGQGNKWCPLLVPIVHDRRQREVLPCLDWLLRK